MSNLGGGKRKRVESGLPPHLGWERSTLNGRLAAGAEGCCDAHGGGEGAPTARGHPADPLSPSRAPNALGDEQAGRVPGPPRRRRGAGWGPRAAARVPAVPPRGGGGGAAPVLPSLGGPRRVPGVRGRATLARGHHPSAQPGVRVCVRVCACVCAACAGTHRCRQRSSAAAQRAIESLLSLASSSLGWFFFY